MSVNHKVYLDPSDEQLQDNIDYHVIPVLSGEDTPAESVRKMLDGYEEFLTYLAEEGEDPEQTRNEMLAAYLKVVDLFMVAATPRLAELRDEIRKAMSA